MEDFKRLCYPSPNMAVHSNKLLWDNTTSQRIIWATDQYGELGEDYGFNNEITIDAILAHPETLQIRAAKNKAAQKERTRKKAEVFTPIPIVDKMNSYVLEEAHQQYPDWKDFVNSTMLEITCGEAPFLVTRYDTETGEYIPVGERVGLLDRKLQCVNENTHAITDWLEQVFRAYASTYGYEYQGDSLMIARINMLMTFVEYFKDKWHCCPLLGWIDSLAEIVTWNVWQMDGLTGRIPSSKVTHTKKKSRKPDEALLALPECKIRWNTGEVCGWNENIERYTQK